MGTSAWSQTTDNQSQSNTTETNDGGDAAKPEASDGTSDQPNSISKADAAALDTLLLGSWVLLSDDATKPPDKDTTVASIARCFELPKLERLDVDPAAEKKLPDAKLFKGDLIYYRTKTGLQRMDLKLGQVELFPEIRKVNADDNKSVWAIRGSKSGFALQFANAKVRGGKGQFMLENERVFLKCGPGPNTNPDTSPDSSSNSNPESTPTE